MTPTTATLSGWQRWGSPSGETFQHLKFTGSQNFGVAALRWNLVESAYLKIFHFTIFIISWMLLVSFLSDCEILCLDFRDSFRLSWIGSLRCICLRQMMSICEVIVSTLEQLELFRLLQWVPIFSRIMEQCLNQMPEGDISTDDAKCVPPSRHEMKVKVSIRWDLSICNLEEKVVLLESYWCKCLRLYFGHFFCGWQLWWS